MKIGIFIEPPNRKFAYLSKWKKIIKKKFGNQKYLSHPLHTTIAVFDLKKKIKKDFYLALKKEMSLYSKFKIYVTKPSIFYNDPLTGGDTLFFKIKKNQKIIIFQRKILNHFNKIDKDIFRNVFFKKKKFHLNYKKFGFPFVGKDWIPHFTIASINSRLKKKREIYKDFLLEKNFNKKLEVKHFSIWQINKDKHKKIFKIKLR